MIRRYKFVSLHFFLFTLPSLLLRLFMLCITVVKNKEISAENRCFLTCPSPIYIYILIFLLKNLQKKSILKIAVKHTGNCTITPIRVCCNYTFARNEMHDSHKWLQDTKPMFCNDYPLFYKECPRSITTVSNITGRVLQSHLLQEVLDLIIWAVLKILQVKKYGNLIYLYIFLLNDVKGVVYGLTQL